MHLNGNDLMIFVGSWYICSNCGCVILYIRGDFVLLLEIVFTCIMLWADDLS